MDPIHYKCGHVLPQPIAQNLGRGKARLQRIHYFGQILCAECADERRKIFASQLTHIDGTPYSADEQARYTAHQRTI